MIIDGCIAKLKAGGLIVVEAAPAFTIKTKREIVKAVLDKIDRDARYKHVPALSMSISML